MKNENQNSRRHFSPEDKIKILRLHLLEGQPISEVCEKQRIIPTQFYQWQKTFFENGAAAFAKQPHSRSVGKTEQTIVANWKASSNQGRGHCRDHGRAHPFKKRTWGKLTVNWVAHDIRDQVVDFVRHWSERTELLRPTDAWADRAFPASIPSLAGAFWQGQRTQSTGCRATTGWKPGRRRPLWNLRESTRWKGIDG